MEIKPYWVLVAGLVVLLLFVIILIMPGSRWSRHEWHQRGYRPGPSPSPLVPSSNWFGPGGTRHLLGFDATPTLSEGFASSSSNSSDTTFTMFAMPWCGHCKKASPIFKAMGPTVTIDGKVVNLRHVDCEAEPAAASGYDIEGYPAFFLDHNGKRTKYNGGRDPASFHSFLQQHLSA